MHNKGVNISFFCGFKSRNSDKTAPTLINPVQVLSGRLFVLTQLLKWNIIRLHFVLSLSKMRNEKMSWQRNVRNAHALPSSDIHSQRLLSRQSFSLFQIHRRDSIQSADYIANYFFLNLRVSQAIIKNLKWRISGDNIPITFGKFATLLVQKLKILGKKLTCSQYRHWQFLLSLNIINFWTYDVTNFPKVSKIMSPWIHYFRFSISVLETLELEWQCSQYLELNPTCDIVPVFLF